MLIQELKPKIDGMLRTRPDVGSTAMAGSSLGGLVTAYAGLKRPDVYGRIAELSPSTWWDSDVIVTDVQGHAARARAPALRLRRLGAGHGRRRGGHRPARRGLPRARATSTARTSATSSSPAPRTTRRTGRSASPAPCSSCSARAERLSTRAASPRLRESRAGVCSRDAASRSLERDDLHDPGRRTRQSARRLVRARL